MQKKYPNKVVDYLEKNSYKKWNLEWDKVDGIESVVVIPAICEFENIKKLLISLASNQISSLQRSLIIFVINNSAAEDQEIKADNVLSLEFLRSLIQKTSSDHYSNQIYESGIRIGIVDAASEGKEFDDAKAGVGLARKIGMDMALQVFDYSISDKKIVISLDADCLVDQNYLAEIQHFFCKKNVSVGIVDFEHTLPENEVKKIGILSYEIYLRHYVAGLLFAKSPFAFHTVGSTVIYDHESYVKIGGMNTKKAAEDFYFLQKLAKHYIIHRITSTKAKPSARESWRVPFGTGRSMADFSSKKKDILVFDPDVYVVLRDWLQLYNSDSLLTPDSISDAVIEIHPELYNFLKDRGFRKDWKRILDNSKSAKQLIYQRKNWFDAFETLKLIHHFRDTSFPMIDIKTGVEKLFKIVQHSANLDFINDTNSQEESLKFYLSELKMIENNLYNNFLE